MQQAKDGTVWGLLSDVHGNVDALERALALLSAAGATRFAFLGDYLGRGDSDACVARIRQVADVALLGNRDLDWQDRVSAESKAWVLSLPRTACLDGLLFAHGDARLTLPLSTAQIARDFQRTWAELERANARIFAFGHSHYARIWRKLNLGTPAEQLGPEVPIEPGYRYMVNVGTTGLPFPGKGGPSVAVIDLRGMRIRQLALTQQ